MSIFLSVSRLTDVSRKRNGGFLDLKTIFGIYFNFRFVSNNVKIPGSAGPGIRPDPR